MNREEIIMLYDKEREYEEQIFGDYKKNKCLNLASFLAFIEHYLERSKNEYVNKWEEDSPDWLINCSEFDHQDAAPVKTYENLIKVFALTGAALEAFTEIDPLRWREEGIKNKWK